MLVRVDAGLRRNNVVRRVGLERRMVIRHQYAITGDEVQEIGHLFQVGRNVWVIPGEVNVVELKVNYALDLSSRRI